MEYIPTDLIKKINEFKQLRESYHEQYDLHQQALKQLKKENTIIISSNTGFSLNELENMTIKSYEKEDDYSSIRPTDPTPYSFSNFNHKIYRISEQCGNDNYKSLYTKLSIPERLNQIFLNCVKVIASMDIKIHTIEKKINNYGKCSWSEDRDVFIFHCKKNDCEIEFKFSNDDLPDRFISATKTKNLITNEVREHHVLYYFPDGYNNDKFGHQKLMATLDGLSMTEIKNKLYGHIIQLPSLLPFKITTSNPFFDKELDRYDVNNYYIKIQQGNQHCVITPGCSLNQLYLSKDILNFHNLWKQPFYKISYKSENDLDDLISYIKSYFNRLDNHGCHHFSEKFKTQFPELKVRVATDVKNLEGFDLYTILNENKHGYIHSMPNSCYIVDYYGIRFVYDKRIDPLNCVLTIESLSNDLFNQKFNQFYPLITIHDSYDNCVEMIKVLIQILK